MLAPLSSNADLTREIILCQQTNTISPKLAEMLILFVERLASKSSFRHYSYREDMQSAALCQLCSVSQKTDDPRPAVLKFDVEYCIKKAEADSIKRGKRVAPLPPNPFAYVSQVITNVFRRSITLEKRHTEINDDIRIGHNMPPSARRQLEDEINRSSDPIPKIDRPDGQNSINDPKRKADYASCPDPSNRTLPSCLIAVPKTPR